VLFCQISLLITGTVFGEKVILNPMDRRSHKMARKRYTSEQIIRYLRQAEVLTSQNRSILEICREIGVSENTYYRWRKEYGGMGVTQAKRLKELEKENTRLKRAVADLTLDNLILKEASEGNF
jgi:putative transposase